MRILVGMSALVAAVAPVAPAAAANSPVVQRGVLVSTVIDNGGPYTTAWQLYIYGPPGEWLALDVSGDIDIPSGNWVDVSGTRTGNRIDVIRIDAVPSLPPVVPPTTGTVRMLFALVHFGTPDSKTPQGIRNEFDSYVRPWFQDVSGGRFDVIPTVTGWYQISTPAQLPDSGGCDYNQIATEAEAALRNNAYVVDQYDFVGFYFPKHSGCAWGGLGKCPERALGTTAKPA